MTKTKTPTPTVSFEAHFAFTKPDLPDNRADTSEALEDLQIRTRIAPAASAHVSDDRPGHMILMAQCPDVPIDKIEDALRPIVKAVAKRSGRFTHTYPYGSSAEGIRSYEALEAATAAVLADE